MRKSILVSLVGLTFVSSFAVAACTASPEEEEVGEVEDALVQFPAAAFTNAPALAYGQTSAAQDTSRTVWGVVKLAGTQGDNIVATVAATTPDRRPRAYLVEQRADGKYVAILSGTNSVDGLVKAKLEKTQTYFIVFRDYSRRNATFTVKLEKAGGLPASCSGTPLLNQGFVDRTAQAQTPGLTVTGQYKSTIRRCNVATGCANAVVQDLPNRAMSFSRRSDGKWLGAGPFSVEHDGATGELEGTANVVADDGRNIAVQVSGAATTSCISASGSTRSAIDAITYYDVEVTYQATTPGPAARTPIPTTPPDNECDGQVPITDEEVLARFQPGSSTATLGTAAVKEDRQYCHPETGCRDWERNNTTFTVNATGVVLGASSLGVRLYNGQTNVDAPLEDGIITVTHDALRRGLATATYAARISDTHIQIEEANVYTSGEFKHRRYVCIPIPAHP